jgi:transposase
MPFRHPESWPKSGRGAEAAARVDGLVRTAGRQAGVDAAVLVAGSEKAAAHRLGLSHSTVKHHLARARSEVGTTTTAQLVWILVSRLPEAEVTDQEEDWT